MKYSELVDQYLEGKKPKGSTANASYVGSVFYSYSTTICTKIGDLYVLRRSDYSKTTKKHVSVLMGAIPSRLLVVADFWDGRNISTRDISAQLETEIEELDKKLRYVTSVVMQRELQYEFELMNQSLNNLRDQGV